MALKGEGTGPLPPLLSQYVELVEQVPDYLVLFQVGDFYECFGEDAERLARLLGLVLTRKPAKDFVTPMAGIPVRSADRHIERLLAQGVRVAVADQVENAAEAEGLVRREITQLITPGTVTDEALLRPDATYLAAVATGDGYGLVLLDLSTGEFRGSHLYARSSLFDELQRYRPAELLLAPELAANEALRADFEARFPVMRSAAAFELARARAALCGQFGSPPVELDSDALTRAAGAVLAYAAETQRGELPQVTGFVRYDPGAFMLLDEVTSATLELFEPRMPGGHTLFETLDRSRTAPGRRLLRAWLRHPLLDEALIAPRLDAVEALMRDAVLRSELRKVLHKLHDLERLATRIATGRASARDLSALARSAALVPRVQRLLADQRQRALQAILQRSGGLEALRTVIEAALVAEPPQRLSDGGLLRDGFDSELDRHRRAAEEGRSWIAALEAQEREASGIPTLKVGFNAVHGYYFEVTRPYYRQVPTSYRPIQTLKDRQRYSREDLRDRERAVLRADEAARGREYAVFDLLRKDLTGAAQTVREVGQALAELDVVAALAEVAAEGHYCRPAFSSAGRLTLHAARHPVVERHQRFIPNDADLSPEARLVILTGPNMSGKSTYLRQTALIALMAQVGSFVPAERALLPLFDRLYTRIGASDDLAGGRSTFMVEMGELARILQNAGARSLVLLDEIGRGTSTFDGLALAWAASEYLHDRSRALALFATHYFELTALADTLPAARNLHVAAHEEEAGLVFYHQVLPGPASKAYGLEVARLAGVPKAVLERARAVLAGLEAQRTGAGKQVLERLLALDPSRLSPLEALELLFELRGQAHGLIAGAAGHPTPSNGVAGEAGDKVAERSAGDAPGDAYPPDGDAVDA
jgi:DNA mismatch repair protein MutS